MEGFGNFAVNCISLFILIHLYLLHRVLKTVHLYLALTKYFFLFVLLIHVDSQSANIQLRVIWVISHFVYAIYVSFNLPLGDSASLFFIEWACKVKTVEKFHTICWSNTREYDFGHIFAWCFISNEYIRFAVISLPINCLFTATFLSQP